MAKTPEKNIGENRKRKGAEEVMDFRDLTPEEEVVMEEGDELELASAEDKAASLSSAHDDYDWGVGKRNVTYYPEAERERQRAIYDATLNSVQEMVIVNGKVLRTSHNDVLLDLNGKSDGIVSASEFRDRDNIKAGDTIEVYVERQEDKNGQMVISRRKAKLIRAWENIVAAFAEQRIVSGKIINKTKGGLIVDVDGLEAFLPGSQIDIKPVGDAEQQTYMGRVMEFKVVKINENIKNAVISHKAIIESDLEAQRSEILSGLDRGQVLEGTVKNITDFGAFLDLGGVDGLLYITDISWGRVKHPSEALSLNQKVNVVVLDFDDDKRRISLGLKQLTPHPWEVLAADVVEGSVVKGKIVNVEDYGAFLEIQPGVEGLIHVSEVSWSNQMINAKEYFKVGSEHSAKVVTIDRDDRKMSLSIKQLSDDPWTKIEEKFGKGSRHTGVVKNLTQYGVFVEMEQGIGGMIHISDLSWTKRYNHPADFVKVGDTIEVIVLEADSANRKLSLGHKQMEENPWDTFETVFPVGSFHEATVLRRDERGAIVQLPYGLEAFAPARHLKKDDGSMADVEQVLMFKVLEFNRDDKRILVSHTRYLEDLRKENEVVEETAKVAVKEETTKAVKKTQEKVERSTLGDIQGFAELKQQMDDNNK